MKKTITLVRHATAEDQTMMISDFQRELVGKGKADALEIGKWLAANVGKPERIVTSSAPRASQTAILIADQVQFNSNDIVAEEALYSSGARAYLATVNATQAEVNSLMLVGHNPDITYFAEYLSGADIGSMSKCSVVVIDFDLEWAEISAKTGKFVSYTTPRQLRESL